MYTLKCLDICNYKNVICKYNECLNRGTTIRMIFWMKRGRGGGEEGSGGGGAKAYSCTPPRFRAPGL